jgi:hypothetical protein
MTVAKKGVARYLRHGVVERGGARWLGCVSTPEADEARMRRLCLAGTRAYALALERGGYVITGEAPSGDPELSRGPSEDAA